MMAEKGDFPNSRSQPNTASAAASFGLPYDGGGADLAGVAQVLSAKDRGGLCVFSAGGGEPSNEVCDQSLAHRWSRPMGECVDASPLVLRVRMADNTGM